MRTRTRKVKRLSEVLRMTNRDEKLAILKGWYDTSHQYRYLRQSLLLELSGYRGDSHLSLTKRVNLLDEDTY